MKTTTLINYNNKLNCDAFIHIAAAPTLPISEGDLPIRELIVEQAMSSSGSSLEMSAGILNQPMKFEADMIGFIRYKLKELPSILVYLSHGVSVEKYRKLHAALRLPDELAVYTYLKIK